MRLATGSERTPRTAVTKAAEAGVDGAGFPSRSSRTEMAGHSQFKNIMHRKGRQDALRARQFTRLLREVQVAARSGLADPASNPRLRAAIQAARGANVPRDNIDRAIKRAQGAAAESYDEVRYEGYGPDGVAVIVEALTDNRNRTASEIRAAFARHGGALGETNSVSFQFDRVGQLRWPSDAATADAMLEAAVEVGAADCESGVDGHEVTCAPDDLASVRESARGAVRTAFGGSARLAPASTGFGRRRSG